MVRKLGEAIGNGLSTVFAIYQPFEKYTCQNQLLSAILQKTTSPLSLSYPRIFSISSATNCTDVPTIT